VCACAPLTVLSEGAIAILRRTSQVVDFPGICRLAQAPRHWTPKALTTRAAARDHQKTSACALEMAFEFELESSLGAVLGWHAA